MTTHLFLFIIVLFILLFLSINSYENDQYQQLKTNDTLIQNENDIINPLKYFITEDETIKNYLFSHIRIYINFIYKIFNSINVDFKKFHKIFLLICQKLITNVLNSFSNSIFKN